MSNESSIEMQEEEDNSLFPPDIPSDFSNSKKKKKPGIGQSISGKEAENPWFYIFMFIFIFYTYFFN